MDIYLPAARKPITWLGSLLADMRARPGPARRNGGVALDRVQRGLMPPGWKPLPLVGSSVQEVRIRTGRAFRILYVATRPEAVYVLHVFEKKTQRTAWTDLTLARRRLASLEERP